MNYIFIQKLFSQKEKVGFSLDFGLGGQKVPDVQHCLLAHLCILQLWQILKNLEGKQSSRVKYCKLQTHLTCKHIGYRGLTSTEW